MRKWRRKDTRHISEEGSRVHLVFGTGRLNQEFVWGRSREWRSERGDLGRRGKTV